MCLVSAVITSHKRTPEVVERALKSILCQTYTNIEIIVVDDSPSDYPLRDEVKRVVEKYADRNVTYVQHETCKGACAARNTGLALSKGEFIGFLDDDDEWKPNKIERQLTGFENDDIALVYCGSEVLNETTGTVTKFDTLYHKGNVFDLLFILDNFIGSCSYPLIRNSALREIGGFDELMQSAQDYDAWMRLSERYEVNYIEEVLVRYHVHEADQITKSFVRRINGLERLNQKNADYLKTHKTAWHIRTIKLAPAYAGNGQAFKAIKTWMKAAFRCPGKVKINLRFLRGTLGGIYDSMKKRKSKH